MNNIIKLMSSGILLLGTVATHADQVILDDLIVDGSACIGFDCVNGESFGFDTIRIKENNLRIRAQDTSSTAAFPTNDWQITFNDSSNGGADKFSVDDIDGGRTPFTIEAGAPSHSLYVDDGGRLGLGTSTPVVDVHTKSGNTPTLRLEQDGSSGFAPQTWDVAGNETNFFIRDATNGSTLPFRIQPGASSSVIFIKSNDDIGIGTSSPAGRFHIENTAGDDVDDFIVTADGNMGIGTVAPSAALHIQRAGAAKLSMSNGVTNWIMNSNNSFRLTTGGATAEFFLNKTTGNLEILGTLTTGGVTCSGGCDLLFAAETSIDSIEDHATQMWTNSYLPAVGPTAEGMPMNLSEKTGGILAELEKAHIYIEQLHHRLEKLEAERN